MKKEVWKTVPQHPNYQASNLGRIRSVNGVLSPNHTKRGYRRIKVEFAKPMLVHRLIWMAHKGEIPNGLLINHIDGDGKNNKLSNLELSTHKQNSEHAISILNRVINNSGKRALCESDVRTIRFFAMRGTHKILAKIYKIPDGSITKIKRGITYRAYPFTDEERKTCAENTKAPRGHRKLRGTQKIVSIEECLLNPSLLIHLKISESKYRKLREKMLSRRRRNTSKSKSLNT